MLPKRYKLKLRREADFFNQAERYFSQYFTIFYRENDRKLESVVVVPKKVLRLATTRNKLKRQIYAVLTPILESHRKVPYSLVIVAKPTIQSLSSDELREELTTAIKKIV